MNKPVYVLHLYRDIFCINFVYILTSIFKLFDFVAY